MKSFMTFNVLFLFGLLAPLQVYAQDTPGWTRDINALPDSTPVFPVRVSNDLSNNVYVLSTYYKSGGPVQCKIYLKKFNSSGTLLWTLIYDNNGNGQPRGYDMAIDPNGFCYITGGFTESPYKPLLLKVSPGGTVVWMKDSCKAFNSGSIGQVICKNDRLYLGGSGIASFDTSGVENWSKNVVSNRIAVDSKEQLIVSGTDGSARLISRFDRNGTMNFSDSLILGRRIATDQFNSIYVLTDLPAYWLVKYDSLGNFKWSRKAFPAPPAFGDIGFEVLCDQRNDVIVTGLSDSLYKLSAAGKPLWSRSMQGLDAYRSSSSITFDNHIAIAGSPYNGTDYYLKIATFNLDGKMNWYGTYNGQSSLQEFAVDLAIDNSGIYAVENNNQNGTLLKFDLMVLSEPDFSQICVDSVWYDPVRPNHINVRIFNGSVGFFSYPSVQILKPNGDTISNHGNKVVYFGQLANSYQVYQDSIDQGGIADFSAYTFLLSTDFGDTTVKIHWCNTTGIRHAGHEQLSIKIFPNPFHEWFSIEHHSIGGEPLIFKLYDATGRLMMQSMLGTEQIIRRNNLPDGLYFYSIESVAGFIQSGKIVAGGGDR